MVLLKKIAVWISRHMALFVVLAGALALMVPGSFAFVKPKSINVLLGVVMFGMGLTLKPQDFRVVFRHPRDVLVGFVAQFSIMPLAAFLLVKLFRLSPELAIGVILVGTCPGGTASNVITYLARGDVALSVGMTTVSTLFAPIMTPLLTYLYAGQSVDVNPVAMFLSIVQVVLLPVVLGLVINRCLPRFADAVAEFLPLLSTVTIVVIVGAIVNLNAERILSSGLLVLAVVILHNLLGLALGYGMAKAWKLDASKCRAICIEVGMQNSGLAVSLAATHFALYPLATIPGAVFSVWHNVSGAILANLFLRRPLPPPAAPGEEAAVSGEKG